MIKLVGGTTRLILMRTSVTRGLQNLWSIFKWNDDDVYYVLDQHAEFDF
jgi:hypothetical protein